jgi:signal transduction histidine kinase
MFDPQGRFIAVHTALVDISARRKAERALEASRAEEIRLRGTFEALDKAWLAFAAILLKTGEGPLRDLLQAIIDHARALTGAAYGALGIGLDPERSFSPWVEAGVPIEAIATWGERLPRPVGVLGLVARGSSSLRIADVRKHAAFRGLPAGHAEINSFLGSPIRFGGKSIGTIYLANKIGGGMFTAEDEHILQMIAERAGIAMEIARLASLEARERRRLAAIAEASRLLTQTTSSTERLRALARAAVPWLADGAAAYTLEAEHLRFVAFAHHDADEQHVVEDLVGAQPPIALDDPHNRLACICRAGRPELAPDFEEADWTPHVIADRSQDAAIRAHSPRSLVVAPLVASDRLVGMIALGYAQSGRRYSAEDLPQLEEFVQRAAILVDNARLYEQTRAAVRARDELLGIVSHDLRSPLSTIAMSAEMLARSAERSPAGERRRGRRQVDAIALSARRMSRLVSDLLEAATLEAGKLTIETNVERVAPLVDELCAELEIVAAERSVRLVRDVDATVPPIRCDKKRLLQVLANLVGNAVKFSPKGRSVRVRVNRLGPAARFEVEDEGIGIAEEHVPHVFEQHWRVPGSKAGGAGLGLFIAKGIVETHGGAIGVKSRLGAGSTFWFTIPLATEARAPS